MENTDKETRKILSEGEELKLMTEGKGWEIVRNRLYEKVASLSDIVLMEVDDPQKLLVDIAANKRAIKILIEWLQDIEGDVQRHELNKKELSNKNKNAFIKYLGEE